MALLLPSNEHAHCSLLLVVEILITICSAALHYASSTGCHCSSRLMTRGQ
jgi:hypothetical protein